MLYLLYVFPFSQIAALPDLLSFQQWLDNNSSDSRSLSPHNNSDFSSAGGSPPPMGHLNPPMAPSTPSQNPDDEVIPTAIVIKNIPFNVKRETLLDIIVRVSLTILSYEFDNLAFPLRHPYQFPHHMLSTIILTSRALSGGWLLPTSASR